MDAFNKLFDLTINTVSFNPEWHNGTGYLNGVVYVPLAAVSKTIDDKKRRIILMPVEGGNIVVFERDPVCRPGLIVSNRPKFLPTDIDEALASSISEVDMITLLAWYASNHK